MKVKSNPELWVPKIGILNLSIPVYFNPCIRFPCQKKLKNVTPTDRVGPLVISIFTHLETLAVSLRSAARAGGRRPAPCTSGHSLCCCGRGAASGNLSSVRYSRVVDLVAKVAARDAWENRMWYTCRKGMHMTRGPKSSVRASPFLGRDCTIPSMPNRCSVWNRPGSTSSECQLPRFKIQGSIYLSSTSSRCVVDFLISHVCDIMSLLSATKEPDKHVLKRIWPSHISYQLILLPLPT
jgi:hypothetical protein